jgi:AraC family transcriptional regulator
MAGLWRNEGAFELMLVEIEPSVAALFGDDPTVDNLIAPALQIRDQHLYHLTLALKAEEEEQSPAGPLYKESLIIALLTRLFMLQRRVELVANQTTSVFTPFQQRELAEFIEANLANDLSIPALASVVGYGLSRFKTLFKVSFGAAPHAYVLQRRVERAKCLIETSVLPLCQVALETGFAHQSHMANAFHRKFNISPGDLRRMRNIKS